MSAKHLRDFFRSERTRLYREFNVGRIVSYTEDSTCLTVVVEFRECCSDENKLELAKHLETILGKKVHLITPPPPVKFLTLNGFPATVHYLHENIRHLFLYIQTRLHRPEFPFSENMS